MSLWDEYQDFSTNAKPHGGANAYLSFFENNAKEEGRDEGRVEGGIIGVLATLAAGGIIYGGIWAFGKAKKHFSKRKQEKQLAPIVRQEFLDNVERYEEQEDIEQCEEQESTESPEC